MRTARATSDRPLLPFVKGRLIAAAALAQPIQGRQEGRQLRYGCGVIRRHHERPPVELPDGSHERHQRGAGVQRLRGPGVGDRQPVLAQFEAHRVQSLFCAPQSALEPVCKCQR